MSRILFAAACSIGLACSGIAFAQTNSMSPDNMAAPSPNAMTPSTMKPAPMKPDTMSPDAMKPATVNSSTMKPGDTDNMAVSHSMSPTPMGNGASQ